jgi:hypothetical protein
LYDYEKLQRAGKDLEKVEPLRVQSEAMALYYERLNNELKRDIPILIDDRALFYTPLFANWIFHCHEYYRMASENIRVLEGPVSTVDLSTLHNHPQVITSEEASYYNVEIKDAQPDDIDDAPPAYQSSHPGGGPGYAPPPSQGGYYPPQQGGGYPPQQGGYPPQQGGYPPPQHGGYPPPQQHGGYAPPPGQYGGGPQGGYPPPHQGGNYGGQGLAPPPPGTRRAQPPPPGANPVLARAIYPFVGQDASELTFSQDEILTILSQDGEWWRATSNTSHKTGLIPGKKFLFLLS